MVIKNKNMYLLASQTEVLEPTASIFGHQIYQCGIHRHRALECLWVLSGQIEVQIDDRSVALANGDLITINGDSPHATQSVSDDNLVICLQHQFDGLGAVECGPWLNNALQIANTDAVRRCLAHIWWESNHKPKCWRQAVEARLQELKLLFMRYFSSSQSAPVVSTQQPPRLDSLIRYLEQHYAEHISLQAMADRLALSEAYLSRYFKEHTGYNFHRYLTLLRLEQSLADLAARSQSITDIAYNNGFPSVKAYNTAFKREYDCTPSEFRQRETEVLSANQGRLYGTVDPGNIQNLITPWLQPEQLYL